MAQEAEWPQHKVDAFAEAAVFLSQFHDKPDDYALWGQAAAPQYVLTLGALRTLVRTCA